MKFSSPESLPAQLRDQITYRDLAVGERLFRRGDAAINFFVLETGRIRIVRPTIDNKTATLQFVEPDNILGENALFDNAYYCSAIANVTSRVIVYPQSCFISILQYYPELVEDFLAMLIQKIKYFQTNVELREIRAAHQRVLQYLKYAANFERKVVDLDRPLQDIAAQIGFTPATLSRALTKLETEGLITRQFNAIILSDFTAA